jgi:hypothetical protein
MDEELGKIRADIGPEEYDQDKYPLARQVFDQVATSPTLVEFLTLPAYELLP